MPHDPISALHEKIHHSIAVDLKARRIPEVFEFEVDERLKRIRAGQSQLGWLYLAYLHAITASPLPDRFTGMTGTEMSLQILQSAQCWSCQPLDNSALVVLQEILNLSHMGFNLFALVTRNSALQLLNRLSTLRDTSQLKARRTHKLFTSPCILCVV